MTKSMKLALSLVLAAGAVMPAMAQENFPDAPSNHWAFEALGKMKAEGLLVGYPDGMFRGTRPASRYELAVAMHAVYANLKNLIDGLTTQMAALKDINPQDIQNLKDQVAKLQDQINAMKGWGDDIAALKKATSEFDKELRSLGVDVEAMKKDLGDLQDRVTRLEKKKPAVDISGDVNFFAVTTNSSDNRFGSNRDGRIEGASGNAPIGLFHDLAVLHEGAFTFAGTNETGPKWKGTIVVSNAFGPNGLGNQSSLATGGGFGGAGGPYSYAQGLEDVYIQDLSVKFDTSLVGFAFNAEAGRVAYSLTPYIMKRAQNQSYFENERWNDGKYRFDGAILGFNFGGAKVHVFGGNNSNLTSVQGVDLNPMIVANTRHAGGPNESLFGTYGVQVTGANGILGQIDKTLGADAEFGLGRNGHINLAYLLLQQEGRSGPNDNLLGDGLANRDNLFGADVDFNVGPLKISGGYHQSNLTANDTAANSHDNEAFNAKVAYSAGKFNLWGGYREVDQNFFAPGDWGRLGPIVNPGNIKGFQAGLWFDLTHAISLSADGEWDKGKKNELNNNYFNTSSFGTDTKINKYAVRLDLKVNPNLGLYGAWEDTKFENLVGGGSDAQFDWTTVGIGYGLSANAKFNLAYEFSNISGGGPNGRGTGGILTSQLTIKF